MLIRSTADHEASKWLLDINAISCRVEAPFIFTSGWKSPVYVNCRKIISHVAAREAIVHMAINHLTSNIDLAKVDVVAGGETAGIPYAAWISAALRKPMLYVRKKQKEFGLQEQIVGDLAAGANCLLVEDLNTDGQSKVHFASVIRSNGGVIRDVFSVFNYGVFPNVARDFDAANLNLYFLTDWQTTIRVAIETGHFDANLSKMLTDYLRDPISWSSSH